MAGMDAARRTASTVTACTASAADARTAAILGRWSTPAVTPKLNIQINNHWAEL